MGEISPACDPSKELMPFKKCSSKPPKPPEHYLVTDASNIGWGAMLDNLCLRGNWTESEMALGSSSKEMIAIYHVLRDHSQHLKSKSILVQCDNRAVVLYIQRKILPKRQKSDFMKAQSAKVLRVIDEFNMKLSIDYIPGNLNYHADHLSRKKRIPEWHLLPNLTKEVFEKWGTPMIDLFASRTAHVVPHYCTLNLNDKSAVLYDAFSLKWHFQLAWVFPPPYLMPKVLAHMNNASGTYLVVTLKAESMFWGPDLKTRAMAPPWEILEGLEEVLVDTSTGFPPPGLKRTTLEIWKCEGGIT